jgi:hypothetical protein
VKTHDDASLVARFQFMARVASVLVVLVSCLVLVGWILDIETLKSVVPGLVAMNPGGTAVGFLLGGIALWLLIEPHSTLQQQIAQLMAAGVVLIAVLRFAGYVTSWDGGPDRWLFAESLARYETPNRTKRPTAWRRTRLLASFSAASHSS